MKKRKKVIVWLLIAALLMTQVCFPGVNVRAEEGQSVVEKAEQEEFSAQSEKEKEEAESQKKDEKSEKTEKSGKTDEKEAVEKESDQKEKETKDTQEKEPDKKEEVSKDSEEKGMDQKEEVSKDSEEKGTDQKEEISKNTEEESTTAQAASTEEKKESQEENSESTTSTETKTGTVTLERPLFLEGEDEEEDKKEDNKQELSEYQVKFVPVDQEGNVVSGATVTMKTSTDKNSWSTVSALDSGQYKLPVKENEKDCYYKFSITAINYETFDSEIFSFTQESNPYFNLSSVTDGEVTIRPIMEKKTKPDQYRVEIKVLGEDGNPLTDARIEMKWRKDIYKWYEQDAISPGTYDLYTKDDVDINHYRIYQFTIVADGYVNYESNEFQFRSGWWNPYFNVDTVEQTFTITVKMTLETTALENAKISAIKELENYKKLEDYRQAEQDQIKSLIKTWSDNIHNAETINLVNWNLNRAKVLLDRLKTNLEYEDEEYRSRIYFLTDDGQKTYVNEYGEITITNIDSGNFYITHPDGSLYANNEWDAKWRCVYEYNDLDHPDSIAFQVIVGTYGQFAGKFVGNYDATVTLSDLGRAIKFKVKVVDGRVDQLRAYVDGRDVSGKTITVAGSEKKKAVIQGRLKGTNRWISIPAYSLKYTAGGSTSVNHASAEFRTWGESGSITYTLDSDRSVSVTVYIKATIVHATGIQVICPSKATVGDWNGAFNQYVGIMEGQGGYQVVVTPYNTSNPSVTWEDLTPDVATFQTLHAAGIVPKKAGTAKFKVSCVENPKISTMVTIMFQYEKPLKTAEAEQDVYYAKPSDKTINLNIITNGQKDSSKGASEQRFKWSYSTSGVVKVTDSVHYDKSSVTIPNWFSHTISILGEGTVYVTGTPYDETENCKPVKFKVVVSSDVNKDKEAAERVEKLILNIGKVTLEKKNQIKYARSQYQALTSTQKGLVDDDIYAKLVAAELEIRRLERGDSDDDSDGDGGEGGNGSGGSGENTTPGGSEGENQTGGSENSGTSGEGNDDVPGGDTGTNPEESGSGNDPSAPQTDSQNPANPDAKVEDSRISKKTVQAATNNQTNSSSGKKAGKKGGKKFYEVDIQDITNEVKKMVNEISPEMKILIIGCVLAAFLYGFFRRRSQYLKDKNEKKQ